MGRGRGYGRGRGQGRSTNSNKRPPTLNAGGGAARDTAGEREVEEKTDAMYGFRPLEDGSAESVGYLVNMLPTTVLDEDGIEHSALDLFFLRQDGSKFKGVVRYEPYFYVSCPEKWSREVTAQLERRYSELLSGVEVCYKEDLDMLNHLSGKQRLFIKLRFRSVSELLSVRSEIKPLINKNQKRQEENTQSSSLNTGSVRTNEKNALPKHLLLMTTHFACCRTDTRMYLRICLMY